MRARRVEPHGVAPPAHGGHRPSVPRQLLVGGPGPQVAQPAVDLVGTGPGEEHVRAICSITFGTKSKNLNDIGKFGIGFKSVYAYTKRPEVHSGVEHFAIEHYVHPRPVAARPTEDGQTLRTNPSSPLSV